MVDEKFQIIADRENIEFSKKCSKWWNGNAYLPLYNYFSKFFYKNGLIKISYEYRQSEFSKPSVIDGGMLGDRHICNIVCEIKAIDICNFKITERSILSKLLYSKTTANFKVKCLDIFIRKQLLLNINLLEIFKIAENSPEFSPLITGQLNKQGLYIIKINYNNQMMNSKIIDFCIDFCKDIINLSSKK